jgi:predicted DNA-binding transcriptional regulator AlpA
MSDVEVLIPDPQVAKEFGISLMAIWRWDHDPRKAALGWPPKVQLGKRNYRHRSQLEAFKANLLKRALAEREAAA